jgi:hypothetical protein
MARVEIEGGRQVMVLESDELLAIQAGDWDAVLQDFVNTSMELTEKRKQVEYLAGELHQAETDRAALRIEVQELKARLGFGPGEPAARPCEGVTGL